MAQARKHKTRKPKAHKGHIPLPILEKRAKQLVNLVHKRGGHVG